MKFTCVHCGHCCTNKSVQASISLGDIKRIIELTGKNAIILIEEGYIGLVASGDPETNIYDIEIGLKYPCSFRKDQRCSIYQARPLNCRMFPIGILTEIKFEEVKDHLDEDFKCRNFVEYDEENLEILKDYKEKLAQQILDESKTTDQFMSANGLNLRIDISKNKDFKNLRLDGLTLKEQACEKIKFCESIIDYKLHEKLPELLEKELEKHSSNTDRIPILVQK